MITITDAPVIIVDKYWFQAMLTTHDSTCKPPGSEKCVNVKYKYANEKALCNFLFVDNSNVCPICHRLRNINGRIVHDLDPDL